MNVDLAGVSSCIIYIVTLCRGNSQLDSILEEAEFEHVEDGDEGDVCAVVPSEYPLSNDAAVESQKRVSSTSGTYITAEETLGSYHSPVRPANSLTSGEL